MNISKISSDQIIIKPEARFVCVDQRHFVDSIHAYNSTDQGNQMNVIKIDLSHVVFLDSSALGAILLLQHECQRKNCKVILFNPQIHIQDLLQLSRLNKILEIEQ